MRLGLRTRVVAVLAAVSTLTLAVAAVTLFGPLEHHLRASALRSFAQSLRDERAAITSLPADRFEAGDPALLRAAHVLARRNGAEVVVYDATGRVLASTDPDRTDPFTVLAATIASGHEHRSVLGQGETAEAEVALPLRAHGRHVIVASRKPLASVHQAVHVVLRAFALAAAAGLTVAVLAGLLLAGRLARRVRRLRDTALRVAEIGPDAELKPDRGRDEIGELSRAFATMQDKLREQEDARRAFVATASHELRTPLASLSVMLDLLAEDLRDEPVAVDDARRTVASAEAQVQRLGLLAAELLDLSRIDAGIPLRRESIELPAVLDQVLGEFDVRLTEEHRTIELRAAGEAWATGDPGSVAQIVRVLVDNALRHTPAGGRIEAHADVDAEWARVIVRDDGPGVPVADRDRIFERFARGAQATEGGFGLGLAIGRELARRMDGDLELIEAGGPGATFVLSLPRAPTP